MAAPTPTVRQNPGTGAYLMPEGFRALVTLSAVPSIDLFERDVKPPAIDGGDGINITTQWNVSWETMHPRKLKKLEPVTVAVGYDPDALADVIAQCKRHLHP
jgi:hypothetical protein